MATGIPDFSEDDLAIIREAGGARFDQTVLPSGHLIARSVKLGDDFPLNVTSMWGAVGEPKPKPGLRRLFPFLIHRR